MGSRVHGLVSRKGVRKVSLYVKQNARGIQPRRREGAKKCKDGLAAKIAKDSKRANNLPKMDTDQHRWESVSSVFICAYLWPTLLYFLFLASLAIWRPK